MDSEMEGSPIDNSTRQRKRPFIFHDLRDMNLKESKIIKSVPWLSSAFSPKKLSDIKEDKENQPDERISRDSPRVTQVAQGFYSRTQVEKKRFVDNVHRHLSQMLRAEIKRSFIEHHSKRYPPLENLRNTLLFVCSLSFFAAPLVYMPLGGIQAAYNQQCFLYTRMNVTPAQDTKGEYPVELVPLVFEALTTEWGPQFHCDFTTYVPVSIAILSVIMGWSTFTLWPAMFSLGKAKQLMLSYLLLSFISVIVACHTAIIMTNGYTETCENLAKDEFVRNITCDKLKFVKFNELGRAHGFLAQDVDSVMHYAQIGAWCLAGLAGTKVFISSFGYLLSWYHSHYGHFLFYDDNDSRSSYSF